MEGHLYSKDPHNAQAALHKLIRCVTRARVAPPPPHGGWARSDVRGGGAVSKHYEKDFSYV